MSIYIVKLTYLQESHLPNHQVLQDQGDRLFRPKFHPIHLSERLPCPEQCYCLPVVLVNKNKQIYDMYFGSHNQIKYNEVITDILVMKMIYNRK